MKKNNKCTYTLLASLLFLAGCNNGKSSSLKESDADTPSEAISSENNESSSVIEDVPSYDGEINLLNGFENEDALYVFDAQTGTKKEINEDSSKVLTGNKSLKFNVSQFADATFKFNENVSPRNISEYNYLSFWIYIDYDGEFGLSNSCLNGSAVRQYINSSIKGKQWTKIIIDSSSPVFDVIKYNVAFNNFIICATGSNYGKVLDYNFYIDDVRIYKEGMAGECSMIFDLDGKYDSKLADVECGKEMDLPTVVVYSPQGYSIYGADKKVSKKIIDEKGNEVEIVNGKYTINKIGKYTFISSYKYEGIENVFSSSFEVKLGDVNDVRMNVAYVNEKYSIPTLSMKKLNSEEELDASINVEILDCDGNNVTISNNEFTPLKTGIYKVNYNISKDVNGTNNNVVVSKKLFVNDVHGLITDFSDANSDIFKVNTTSVVGTYTTTGESKISKNENTGSYKLTVANEGGVSLSVNDNFPYKSIDGYKYLSFWVYSDATTPLTLETSITTKKIELLPNTWSNALFKADEIIDDLDKMEVIIYDSINKTKLNCNFYIDDLRIIKDGNPEEISFSSKVTTEDYNEETNSGRRFATNYKYEVDLSIYDQDGKLLTDKASISSITDKRNKNVTVEDGKYFTPITVGKHTIVLTYEKDGIISSCKRIIDVSDQMLLSPFDKFMLLPAEQNKTYTFDVLPELWNYGKIDTTTKVEVLVYDETGHDVATDGYKFTPTSYGKYSVFFVANDTKIASSSALLETSLLVYQAGKYGVVCDFEDDNIDYMESTTYYYGEVSDFFLATNRAHSGSKSAVFHNLSDETREMKFSLRDNNPVGDISNTEYVSFFIYIEDEKDEVFKLAKTAYAGWINETDSSYKPGTLNINIETNKWVEVKILRKDYETLLGGTIFAGQTVNAGGSMWAAANNDFITTFALMYTDYSPISKDVKVYIDDFTLGY